jgi:hypothetical protein
MNGAGELCVAWDLILLQQKTAYGTNGNPVCKTDKIRGL